MVMHLPGGCSVLEVGWDCDTKCVKIEGPCLPDTPVDKPLPQITLAQLCEAVQRGNELAAAIIEKARP